MVGKQLGGYRIESVIGRGGMGIVYLAEQVRLERKVAVKVISPELAHDVAFRTRFERESRLAASIDHPAVVPVYEAGEADGLLYLAMRYVPGTDLKAALAGGPLQPARAAAIVAQVGGALDAAHARGLVHRDVKPGNILLEGGAGGERVYLSDFGLTKRLSSASGITETGFVVGTLDYIAPEQVAGGAVDARTDVYALACVLFHALSGRVPFERDNDMAKMYAHANLEAPSLMEAAPSLPRALDQVVRRGLAKDPDARFASAGDLGRAAEAALRGDQPTVAERSVAVGAAAPGAQDTVAGAEAATAAGAQPAGAAPPGPPTGPTHPLPVEPLAAPPPPRTAPAPPPGGWSPPPPAPGGRSGGGPSGGAIAAAVVLVAIVGVAVALLATGTLGGDDSSSSDTTRTETQTVQRPSTEERTSTGDTPPPASSTTSFEPYTSQQGGFDTVVPTGDEWSEPTETKISDGLSRTRIVGPDGLEVLIDSTPGEAATFKPANRCRQASLPTVPYSAKCVFSGGSLAPCRRSRCVDYLMNAGVDGPGWGVLVGGGRDFAEAERIARRVARALTPLTGP